MLELFTIGVPLILGTIVLTIGEVVILDEGIGAKFGALSVEVYLINLTRAKKKH